MPHPTKKLARSSKRRRAAHFALKKVSLSTCNQCKKSVLPHHVCEKCGYYHGRDVLKMDAITKKTSMKSAKNRSARV